MRIKRYIISLLFIFGFVNTCFYYTYANNVTITSLVKFVDNNYLTVQNIQDENLIFADTTNKHIEADDYLEEALLNIKSNKWQEALNLLLTSLAQYKQDDNKQKVAQVYYNLGLTYRKLRYYETSLLHQHNAYKLFANLDMKKQAALSLKEIGNVFLNDNDYDKAYDYYSRSLKLFEEINNLKGIAALNNNMGIVYRNKKEYKRALKHYQKALVIKKDLKDIAGQAISLKNIGLLYINLYEYEKALPYFQKSLELKIKLNDVKSISDIKNSMSRIYIIAGKHKKAEITLKEALKIAENVKDKRTVSLIYRNFSRLDSAMGKYKSAFQNYIKYAEYTDSINKNENDIKISELKEKFETEKKAKEFEEKEKKLSEIELEKLRNIRHLTFILLGLLIILAIVLLSRNLLKRKANKLLDNKNKQLESSNIALVRARIKAEESDKLKSSFLANMSHEIRTPMNAIIGFANILSARELPDKEKNEFVKLINKSSNELLKLINDIIDIAKIQAGEIKILKTNFYTNKELGLIYNIFKYDTDEKNLKLKLTVPENTNKGEVIITDGPKIRQILSSLIKNAIKFTDTGTIELGYEIIDITPAGEKHGIEQHSFVEFFVKDTGIGIEKEKLPYIFDTFRKAFENQTKLYRGTGLGLAISKHLVKMLGGEIWVETEFGKGTSFFFTIPLVEMGKDDKSEFNNIDFKRVSFDDKTILITEDDKINFFFLKSLLTHFLSVKIIWAQNGQEAVNICNETNEIDLVLMDIKMPIMNGYEATKEIKKIQPDLPIIAQTAYALAGDKEEILEAGCDAYVSKPINANETLRTIVKCLKIENVVV